MRARTRIEGRHIGWRAQGVQGNQVTAPGLVRSVVSTWGKARRHPGQIRVRQSYTREFTGYYMNGRVIDRRAKSSQGRRGK